MNSCLNCALATWNRTKTGRLSRDGEGHCKWKMPVFNMAKAFYFVWFRDIPAPSGGYISRKEPITECPAWEEINIKKTI